MRHRTILLARFFVFSEQLWRNVVMEMDDTVQPGVPAFLWLTSVLGKRLCLFIA
jgi:hypothetical protein